ncbi:hypothetical protein PHMEG_00031551 [Phytophthora megakarya]|uniref:Uncharacterized protein n=1 Tax=Phytophthora megakarya TaxID=4795 RepID=A0A225UXW2_9STRA|nr:hypothetical protein PHMEG_00031551 [Phytophthora megakarya]
MMLKGDVKWTFRNIPVAVPLAAHFAESCSTTEPVIDLALRSDGRGRLSITDPSENRCPFWFHGRVLVYLITAAVTPNRIFLPQHDGPNFINDEKFSSWSSKFDALGLTWDTKHKSVSMPSDKIAKALARITQTLTNA